MRNIFVFFIILLFISSCERDLSLPSKVFVEFSFISLDNEDNLKSGPPVSPPGHIQVNRGSLRILYIEFDGRRDEGRDVFFVSDLPEPLVVDLESGMINQVMSFDIPQGVYNFIEFHLALGGDGQTPLVLEGKVKGQSGEMPIRFEYKVHEKIRIRAETKQKGQKIVLKKDSPSTARIIIDSRFIFQFVNASMFQDANVITINGEQVILINSASNENIFNALANRIEKSFNIIID
jgi:hypothetical protein